MKKLLLDLIQQSGNLTVEEIVAHLFVASIVGLFIFLSYRLSHEGSLYSKKFNVSLVILTVLTTTVMTVIGNNIALSLGMVGALSIVRFRTAIKDSRDTVYIFWTIIVGICCGVGDYFVATIGSAFVFILFLILGRIKNDQRMLLVIRGARFNEARIESIVFQYFGGKARMRAKNTTQSSVEYIFECSKKTLDQSSKKKKSITDAIYECGDIDYMNLVMQNDEISS